MGEEEIEQKVPTLPKKYRFKNVLLGDYNADDRVKVKFLTEENTLKQRLQIYFLRNQRSSLKIRLFNLAIKVLSCVLYAARVILEENKHGYMITSNLANTTDIDQLDEDEWVDWTPIFWVSRPLWFWAIQVTVAIISLLETLLITYLNFKGNLLQQILTINFAIELITTVPFVVTVFYPPWRNLFVPVFLNCWLAKRALTNMLNDLNRAMHQSQSALGQQLVILVATLSCLVFTSVCGFQHLQRGSLKGDVKFFNSLWFVIVTFSTVGYGDMYPTIWPSKLFIMILIGSSFVVLPMQFEELVFTWVEKQKMGGTYSSHRAQYEKHVVVLATVLQTDTIMDFLNEFYAHPKVQDYYVVLLSPSELESTLKLILQIPIWATRVIYIRGSALKDDDLIRCRMQDAEACFIITARNYLEKAVSDQHTILRSWAVRDFAPNCPQYLQIFKPENKMHVYFAEYLVCEDEFKFSLLGSNCLHPGISTFMTLLLHTSEGEEGRKCKEDWMRMYGKCSGNEIYHIKLQESKFFGAYLGKSFTFASFNAHRKYGVCLAGVVTTTNGCQTTLINPGVEYTLKMDDVCLYLSLAKEETSAVVVEPKAATGITTKPMPATLPSTVLTKCCGNDTTTTTTITKPTDVAIRISPLSSDLPVPRLRVVETEMGKIVDRMREKDDGGGGGGDGGGGGGDTKESGVIGGKGVSSSAIVGSGGDIGGSGALAAISGGGQDRKSGSSGGSQQKLKDELDTLSPTLQQNRTMLEVADINEVALNSQSQEYLGPYPERYICGIPPVTPYIGISAHMCHLLRQKKALCCLKMDTDCLHTVHTQASQYNWNNKCTLVVSDIASFALYNFITTLRSQNIHHSKLKAIIFVLEETPQKSFLDTIAFFPLVFWMQGSIEDLDSLLVAGITLCDNLVVVNKESSNAGKEDILADCNTLVAVQTIFRLFPSCNIITELSQTSNMKFMQFRPKDCYSLQLSRIEKSERESGSHLYFMFRLPFAAGCVFSASMLDTILYQAYAKNFVIQFVRMLLGIDEHPSSGHLSSVRLSLEDMWIGNYGRLYQKLCSTSGEIPIGIYRTQAVQEVDLSSFLVGVLPGMEDVDEDTLLQTQNMVKCRMEALGLKFKQMGEQLIGDLPITEPTKQSSPNDQPDPINTDPRYKNPYNYESTHKKERISFVIINPDPTLKLQENDIIYTIKPPAIQ